MITVEKYRWDNVYNRWELIRCVEWDAAYVAFVWNMYQYKHKVPGFYLYKLYGAHVCEIVTSHSSLFD